MKSRGVLSFFCLSSTVLVVSVSYFHSIVIVESKHYAMSMISYTYIYRIDESQQYMYVRMDKDIIYLLIYLIFDYTISLFHVLLYIHCIYTYITFGEWRPGDG